MSVFNVATLTVFCTSCCKMCYWYVEIGSIMLGSWQFLYYMCMLDVIEVGSSQPVTCIYVVLMSGGTAGRQSILVQSARRAGEAAEITGRLGPASCCT